MSNLRDASARLGALVVTLDLPMAGQLDHCIADPDYLLTRNALAASSSGRDKTLAWG
jgi:hypothetical protein